MSRISGFRNVRLRQVVVGFGMIALLLLGAAVVSADWLLDDGTICETPRGRRYNTYIIPIVSGVSAVNGNRGVTVRWTTISTNWSGYHVSVSAFETCSPAYYTINNSSILSKRMRQNCQGYRDAFGTPSGQTLPLYVKVRTFFNTAYNNPRGIKFLGDWSNTVVLTC